MRPAATIGDLVCAQGGIFRDREAIIQHDQTALTYGELAERVDLWSSALGQYARIGLCLPAGPELAVALLAASSRAACAPLSPASPAAQLARDHRDLGLDLIVTTEPRCAELRQLGVPATPSPDLIPAAPDRPGGRRQADTGAGPAEPDDVALLLRTSGTTGRPKVVPLTHANLCAGAANVRRTLGLGPDDRCLNAMPLWHGHGFVAGLLASLAAGASVICVPSDAARDFPGLLHRTGATWYTATPALHRAILDAVAERPAPSHRLRFVRSASSRLPRSLAAELENTFGVPVIEAYGMTEAAHQITSDSLPPRHRGNGSVGAAAGGTRVAILGPDGTRLAAGEQGEVVIQGGGLFQGYENDPTNGSAFIDGWFRTGDLGRLDDDGYLFLTGRIREMINRGGETIAPREVDEMLLEHPDVTDAVAFGIPHSRFGEVVAAAVVPRLGSTVTEADLRQFAWVRLDPAKVPVKIALAADLPRGATGKPDYAELRKLVTARSGPAEIDGYAAGIAGQLAGTWAELLGIHQVSLTDSLSELGSDSLRCTRMANHIAATFGVQVRTDELLVADTVVEQAVLVHDYLDAEGTPDAPGQDS
ncbi:MAG TPA: non-ribosomal peptide synthetase [Streptosporangiaceae bacterium]|nr:non-ribosomal peptide synthetase [Streptosporangiaceae bacterium]